MPSDPLFLGRRVIAILEHGPRDATHKLTTLMALIEHSIGRAHGDAVTLNAGVAYGLARLAGLLQPALEIR